MMVIIQGDSCDIDFTNDEVPTLSASWVATWAIVPRLGQASVADGSLALSADNTALELRIVPTDTETLPVKKYWLVVEVSNADLSYKKEIVQKQFELKKQGIPV